LPAGLRRGLLLGADEGPDVQEQALLTETACGALGANVYSARCDVRDSAAVEIS